MASGKVVASLLVLFTACTEPDQTCEIAESIAANIDTIPDLDCGHPMFVGYNNTMSTDAEYRSAHDCAVAVMSARQRFILRWDWIGVDAGDYDAIVGVGAGDGYRVEFFSHEYSIAYRGTSREICTEVADLGECGREAQTLCLECASGKDAQACN